MHNPTQESVVKELKKFKSHRNELVRQNATELLAAWMEITPESEDAVNTLTHLIQDSIGNDPLTDARYRMLQVLAFMYPRNDRAKDGTLFDFITLTAIEQQDLFVCLFLSIAIIGLFLHYFNTLETSTPIEIRLLGSFLPHSILIE